MQCLEHIRSLKNNIHGRAVLTILWGHMEEGWPINAVTAQPCWPHVPEILHTPLLWNLSLEQSEGMEQRMWGSWEIQEEAQTFSLVLRNALSQSTGGGP